MFLISWVWGIGSELVWSRMYCLVVPSPRRFATSCAMFGLPMICSNERASAWLACTWSKVWPLELAETISVLSVE